MRKLAAVPIGELFSGPANREKCRGCSVCSEDGEENDERRGLVGGNHINARGEGEEKRAFDAVPAPPSISFYPRIWDGDRVAVVT